MAKKDNMVRCKVLKNLWSKELSPKNSVLDGWTFLAGKEYDLPEWYLKKLDQIQNEKNKKLYEIVKEE